ncbi:hypothetical protein NEAUS05_1597, partial [Nematocida ausubeli]
AMLLLFSEGVNIPIKVNNTVLEVYETDKKDQIYFEVPMVIPWLDPVINKTNDYQQKKVKQLISFFQKNATNQKVLSMMEDKCSQEEVAAGKFLNSPKFLIQSYIFGFIDTAERAKEFIQTVHSMMEKYAPKTETPSKGDSVYDRLFKPAGTEAEVDCMALMKKTQEILNTYRVFPFIDSTQIPAYTSVPRYNRKLGIFSANHLEDYSNCVESMILSLFCCLAYDPSDFTYKTDHMGSVSPSLKEFFSPENQPFDTTKANFQKKWCKVVADLKEPNISYCNDRNELDCGIINMLMVIAEIVNISKEEKDKILGFSERLKEKQGSLENSLSKDIQEYTKMLLKRLSKTENVEIQFSKLKSNMGTSGRYDISGRIDILFEQDGIKNTIVLGISTGHSTIDMEPTVMDFEDDRMEKVSEIAGICKDRTKFVENLFAAYLAYEIRNISPPEENEEFMKEQVRTTIENKFADINRLLLIKKISNFNYKKNLVSCSIIYTMDQDLSPDDPLIRFTSNIIGSTELGNFHIQMQILPSVVFADLQTNSKLSYPNIKLSEHSYTRVVEAAPCRFLFECILDCDVDILMKWIRFYIYDFICYRSNEVFIYHLEDDSINKKICKHIFKDGTMKYADIIDDLIIQRHGTNQNNALSIVHFIWLIYLCVEETPNIELIKANLDAIPEIGSISRSYMSHIETMAKLVSQAIQTLSELKNQICKDENDIERFDSFIKIFAAIG